MRHTESQLQAMCVRYFRYQFPSFAKRLIAIPNGGHRNKITAAILKREGTIAGCPDIFLAVPRYNFGGLWIEMKAEKGKLSTAQKEMIKELEQGYKVAVCYSFDDFTRTVNEYMK